MQSDFFKAMALIGGAIFLSNGLFGCDSTEKEPKSTATESARLGPEGQQSLPFQGWVFDVMVEDVDGDGLRDITAIEHGQNQARIYRQTAPRTFGPVQTFDGVGFHPGNFLRWPHEPLQFVLAAEGANEIRSLLPASEGIFTQQSTLKELSPRYAELFHWPGWGESLAISPFNQGFIVLLKNYDPVKGQVGERIVVPLSKEVSSIRSAERISRADLDGDGIEELLFADAIVKDVTQVSYPGVQPQKPLMTSVLYHDDSFAAVNEVHPADLDGDGDTDLLLADEIPPGKLHVLLNDGKGQFKAATPLEFPYPYGIRELRIARDRDGKQILLAAGNGAIAVSEIPPGWHDGEQLPWRTIGWQDGDVSHDMVLTDVDGDGWLDGVVGRSFGDKNLWVVYGPLKNRFELLGQKGFVLN